jgi:hypothetical protein
MFLFSFIMYRNGYLEVLKVLLEHGEELTQKQSTDIGKYNLYLYCVNYFIMQKYNKELNIWIQVAISLFFFVFFVFLTFQKRV